MTVWEDTIVELSPGELLLGAAEAAQRWHRKWGADDRGGVDGNSLDQHAAGALGELAAAKWLRRYWTGPQGRGSGDVGGIIEVRTRRADHRDEAPQLLLQPYDEQHHGDHPFVLVVGRGRTYRVVGYTTPREARRQASLGSPNHRVEDPGNRGRPCLVVEQAALWPVEEMQASEVFPRSTADAA